jgi:hypothetical protein
MTEAEYAEYVRKVVDQAPPLTEATRARLATILRPVVIETAAPVLQAPAAIERRPAA